MALYCDAAHLIQLFDGNTVRDLLSDTGQPAAGDLADNATLAQFLKSASGRLEAACFVSENYSADELADMSENSLALAAEICGRLVMAALMSRRPERFSAEVVQRLEESAESYLQQLRDGARLFNVGNHAAAGNPSVAYPTVSQVVDQNLITQRTKNFYPNPAARLPISRGGS